MASSLAAFGLLLGLSLPAAATDSAWLDQYARAIGVDRVRALDIMRLEDAGSALEGAIAEVDPDWFAGLWVESRAELEVLVYSTDPDAPGLDDMAARVDGLEGRVRVIPVEASLDQLVAEQQSIRSAWSGETLPFSLDINVRENRVEVGTTVVNWNSRDRMVALPPHAIVTGVHMVASEAANIYGGLWLQSCTAGFAVRNSQGKEGISTAGHCSNSQAFNGVSLNYEQGNYGGSFDSQWHSRAADTFLDDVRYGGGLIKDVSGRAFRSVQALGTNVCYYGAIEGWDCAPLVSKTQTCIGPGGTNTCMRLHDDGGDLVDNGDSGGPVYRDGSPGVSAYGLISGCLRPFWETDCAGVNDLIYVATDQAEAGMGAMIMTIP